MQLEAEAAPRYRAKRNETRWGALAPSSVRTATKSPTNPCIEPFTYKDQAWDLARAGTLIQKWGWRFNSALEEGEFVLAEEVHFNPGSGYRGRPGGG